MARRIDVKNLDVYYGGFHAVEGVTMTVEPRTVTAFIGPSGCGKSTLTAQASIRSQCAG
jgi:phosphate transport system ATP-binding protein